MLKTLIGKIKPTTPYLLVLGALLLPRVFALDSFVATDEGAWFIRSANFYYALGQRELAETFRNGTVAVFTMWINTLAFLLKFPGYRGLGQGYLELYDRRWEQIFAENQVAELAVLSTGRLISVAALVFVGLLIFWYLNRNLGVLPALVSMLIMALDPFYIALSRTAHLDAPMGTFLLLCILAYHSYLHLDRRWYDLAISGAAGAFSLLSKLPGLLTIPGVLGLSLIELFASKGEKTNSRQAIGFHLRILFIWLLIFGLVFVAVWPAMWVQPVNTIRRVISAPLKFMDEGGISETVSAQGTEPSGWPDMGQLALRTVANLMTYIRSFAWRTSPIVLFGLLFSLIGFWRKWELLDQKRTRSLVITLVFTAFYFTVVMSIPDKRSEKYIIPAHLALDIVAGIGWMGAAGVLKAKIQTNSKQWIGYGVLVLAILLQSIYVWDNFPYFFTYYNPLFGGSKAAVEVKYVGVGEGLDKAVESLNQLPEAGNLRVLSWYGKGPFSFFFEGQTETIFTGTVWSEEFVDKLRSTDYLVVYTNQWYRDIPPELFDRLESVEPVERIWIESIEYARIYKVSDIALP